MDGPASNLRAWVGKYRPYLSAVAVCVLLIAFLPGTTGRSGPSQLDTDDGSFAAGVPGEPTASAPEVDDDASTDDVVADGSGGDGGAAGRAPSGVVDGPAGAADGGPALTEAAEVGPDCDPSTGRIRVPTRMAPPCQPPFTGDNGGSTYQGVDSTTIRVVYFQPQSNPAVDGALTAAGANNTPPEQRATFQDYVDYFNAHYELFGRQVEVINREGRGASDDDAAALADAIAVATEDRAFAVVGAPTSNAFAEELAARGVLCVCTVSQPQEFYERLSPYVGYTTLMSSTQGYIHRAEYLGNRLAHQPAAHAGTSDGLPMSGRDRVFGLLYFETSDFAYRSGVDFFEAELAKYGVELEESIAFTGPPDLATTQNQARPFIQRMKASGVTSILFAGDPISPAIFTAEATRQVYFPEWIITGSALTDTTIFARTYDPLQWRRAFGVSFLTARFPDEQADAYRLHVWQHGRSPVADNQYAVIYAPILALFTGISLAGPDLTPHTFQRGIFSFPPVPGGRTVAAASWGGHGVWPFTDFTQLDDVTEIWWDPDARGTDEVGNPGAGMYRYVDGGRRFAPGEHPRSPTTAFDPAGSVTIYDQRPAEEMPPEYPRPG